MMSDLLYAARYFSTAELMRSPTRFTMRDSCVPVITACSAMVEFFFRMIWGVKIFCLPNDNQTPHRPK
jgi:hypothetical protein